MEYVQQETTYFQAVGEVEDESSSDSPSSAPAPRWPAVRKWLIRKAKIIDNALEHRIMRWGSGS